MSLASILNAGTSGLAASQAQIRATSTNVSNVNTPGYARTQAELTTRVSAGVGAGVDVAAIKRATNLFLQRASQSAQGDQAAAASLNGLWTQLSPYLGTADQEGALVSSLSQVSSAFSAASLDPASALRRAQIISTVQGLLSEVNDMATAVANIRSQADTQIGQQIGEANAYLTQIASLNTEISRTKASGGDTTGSENQQAAIIDKLASLISIRLDVREAGGVIVRTPDGVTLADAQAGTLSYAPTAQGTPDTKYGSISLTPPYGAAPQPFDAHIDSGSIAGLVHARDGDMLDFQRSLGELAGGIADSLNKAHNASSSYPAPTAMSGRETGLLTTDALGFTGKTTIALVNANGVLAHRVDIDFGAGTMSLDGAAAVAAGATIGSFTTTLNGLLGGFGGASFSNGRLDLSATGGAGLVIQDDAAAPSSRGGRGFSQFFGLNDLVQSNSPTFFETGLTGADAHGLSASALTFEVRDAQGQVVDTKSVTAGGATFSDILNALNNTATGVGLYATFSLNANGALVQTTAPGASAYTVTLTGDDTARGATGLSFSQIFGLGDAVRAGRATDVALNPVIKGATAKMALGQADLSGAGLGAIVMTSGDTRGATALSNAFEATRGFSAAGGLSANVASVNSFAAQVLGLAGARAASADAAETAAKDLSTEVAQRRGAVEGVNLDEELANLTLYQQAYNASARLITAAQDMMDTLLRLK